MTLEELEKSALEAIKNAEIREALEEIRVHYLGRKGELTSILRSLGELPLEERKSLGPKANALRVDLENALAEKAAKFGQAEERIVDISAPAKKAVRGHIHPLSRVQAEAVKIFEGLNFSVVLGPEAESEYYNFDALNIPDNHPAREMWDTFWLKSAQKTQKEKMLLRTHTSPVQARFMEEHQPPFQIIMPGRVFRYEATDQSHEINFYQLEGLMVGKDVNLANFKFIIEEFLKKFFGKKIEFRFRPSYFPFVEPGVEVDIKIDNKLRRHAGSESRLNASGWLEIMGAGMVHPRVFEYAHYNPRDWQGFAFGVGIDRLAMIKYGITDIRNFYSGDLRFIRQF